MVIPCYLDWLVPLIEDHLVSLGEGALLQNRHPVHTFKLSSEGAFLHSESFLRGGGDTHSGVGAGLPITTAGGWVLLMLYDLVFVEVGLSSHLSFCVCCFWFKVAGYSWLYPAKIFTLPAHGQGQRGHGLPSNLPASVGLHHRMFRWRSPCPLQLH